jgi:hypothetical protein
MVSVLVDDFRRGYCRIEGAQFLWRVWIRRQALCSLDVDLLSSDVTSSSAQEQT